MLRQKIQSLEALLSLTLGREKTAEFARPATVPLDPYRPDEADLTRKAYTYAPELRNREKLIAAAEAKVNVLKREYYPDFSVTGGVYQRGGDFRNMWNLSTAINVPIYYKTKQEPAVREAQAALEGAKHELEAAKLTTVSGIRDNLAIFRAAENLMELYHNSLIPKASQDFDLSLSGYGTGRSDVLTVVTRLKAYLDYELLYEVQRTERAKAVARIEALTEPASAGKMTGAEGAAVSGGKIMNKKKIIIGDSDRSRYPGSAGNRVRPESRRGVGQDSRGGSTACETRGKARSRTRGAWPRGGPRLTPAGG